MSVTACKVTKEREDAHQFKEEYEALNEKEKDGKAYRKLAIDKDNPFVYVTPDELVEKIKNKETFYVYFGSAYCPWCRSVIEKAIAVMKEKNIQQVYYIDIWDGDHKEILRDVYTLNDLNEKVLVQEGTKAYQEFLKSFDKVLGDYTLKNKEGETVSLSEKRIFAPNFIYVKNGKGIRLTDGLSDKQSSSSDPLTQEILEDEEKLFQDFFK